VEKEQVHDAAQEYQVDHQDDDAARKEGEQHRCARAANTGRRWGFLDVRRNLFP
jgi:hypothetical protein